MFNKAGNPPVFPFALAVILAAILVICCGAAAFVLTGGRTQPGGGQVCVGGYWDGDECEYGDGE